MVLTALLTSRKEKERRRKKETMTMTSKLTIKDMVKKRKKVQTNDKAWLNFASIGCAKVMIVIKPEKKKPLKMATASAMVFIVICIK